MDGDARRLELDRITQKIIGCVHQVSRTLGAGFLEKVYENALLVELQQNSLQAAQQHRIEVRYRGVLVGDFIADLLVEGCVIVEVKAVKIIDDIHAAQCLNYLRATGHQVCLLVNFATSRATVKRIVYHF
ncbi:MAG: GxxExxY protein [Betaproteobacteria bacterium]|nr:GxxExxY protein [Gammaproteobacteria bacterium]MDH3436819.1 GxxExxY protein [Betaproteobacteria bacterium]